MNNGGDEKLAYKSLKGILISGLDLLKRFDMEFVSNYVA
jgi:hypothetical protein